MPWYSVCYRPVKLVMTIDDFLEVVRHDTVTDYLISCEKGKSDEVTHYQCAIHSTQCVENLRKRLLKPKYKLLTDDDNPKYALDIQTHKEDKTPIGVLIGYCLKEGNIKRTNLSKEVLKNAQIDFERSQETKKQKLDKNNMLTVNHFMSIVVKEHENAECSEYQESIFREVFKKYRKMIPYTMFAKLRTEVVERFVTLNLS